MALNKNRTINKPYWEQNIDAFSGFYDKKSEENILGPFLLTYLYKKLIFPIEKGFMLERFRIVSKFIDDNITAGMDVADIGCGSGIFVKQMAEKGAKVYALDYAMSSVSLVRKIILKENFQSVELRQLDVTEQSIPCVDVAISIGVLTYIEEADKYFDNILPFTKKLLFNYLDSTNVLNIVRRALPLLDVRRLCYHDPSKIKKCLEKRNFKIKNIQKLATGFIINSESMLK